MEQDTIKTRIHMYQFNIREPDQAAQYDEMRAAIKADGKRDWMNAWGSNDSQHPYEFSYKDRHVVRDVELETDFLFSNQWNTADGKRVFDHYEEYPALISEKCKRGHWLEITPEMREIRRNTNICGYCGHRERAERGAVFCSKCLDSEYLKESELHLLRMMPMEQHNPKRPPLTDAERNHLLPQYVERQTTGNDSRNANKLRKQREDIKRRCMIAVESAVTERDGLLWLMDHDVNIDNVIYYKHTDRFCFGWRRPVGPDVKSRLLDVLCEFPFDYDIEE